MTTQRLADRDDATFERMLDTHIDRVATGASDPDVANALTLWRERRAR